MSAPTELVKGNAMALILSCLAREPMHGYRIVKELKDLSEGYFKMGEGTLYPHLHQLEQDGLIEGYWETSQGGRERRMYKITEEGTAALAKKQQEWQKFQANMARVLKIAPEGTGA
ncbi:MAG: helix-turn-helix transcriptional regulator [Armatimonadetes bacterium]|nr:helix-turn-helix transcriptional regulator [Armatimonadota bacterium]